MGSATRRPSCINAHVCLAPSCCINAHVCLAPSCCATSGLLPPVMMMRASKLTSWSHTSSLHSLTGSERHRYEKSHLHHAIAPGILLPIMPMWMRQLAPWSHARMSLSSSPAASGTDMKQAYAPCLPGAILSASIYQSC
jgi:hypothetical protein